MLIAPDCPVCSGAGVLELGAAALHTHTAEAVSLAVEYAVEGAARDAMTAAGSDLGHARQALTMSVRALVKAKLLANGTPTSPPPPLLMARQSPADVHAEAVRITPRYQPGTSAVLAAPPVVWDPDDRPLAAGGIPGFSAGGFICSLSRVSDPLDPLGRSTRDHAYLAVNTSRRARALAGAATQPTKGTRR